MQGKQVNLNAYQRIHTQINGLSTLWVNPDTFASFPSLAEMKEMKQMNTNQFSKETKTER